MFKFKNLKKIKHFLEIKIIYQNENDKDKTINFV